MILNPDNLDTVTNKLLSPLKLNNHTLSNRIVFAAHQTNYGIHNHFEARHAAYYATRAAGGVGLIVLEGSVVHPSDWPYEYTLFGYEPDIIEGYRLVAEAVQAHGTVALAQLTHSGGQGSSHYSQRPLWAPSPVPEVNSREVPQEMEVEEIAEVVTAFAQAAEYAMAGGLNGVEINVGQNSLLRQFMSPLTNMRQDEYGGELDNRLRFTREVIEAVRQRIGSEAIVGLRLSGDEYAPWAGLKPEDMVQIARILTEGEQIDFISVTSGSIYSQHLTRAGLYMPQGYAAHLAGNIKQQVSIPVFAQGSIVEPEMAEQLLQDGQADAIEMTRALIADPDLPRKLAEGRRQDIRPCILCNQDCVVTTVQNPRLSCVHNPAAGYETEAEFGPLPSATPPRKVMVVGGGPAGLEAARVAALRGHRVTLYEQSAELGGALNLAAAAPGRAGLGQAIDWLKDQIGVLPIDIKTGVMVTPEIIDVEAPEAVIVAVGGVAGQYPVVCFEDETVVVNPRQVLAGEVPDRSGEPESPGKAIVLDEAGDHPGMAVAEWLADHGWQVEVVSADMFVGQRLTATMEITPWNQRAPTKNIVFRPQTVVEKVAGSTVFAKDKFSDTKITIEDVDLVVTATYDLPNEDLYFALKEQGLSVYRAGDCVAPRRLGQAILEGYRVGRTV